MLVYHIRIKGLDQCYQHLDNIAMFVILSSKSGSRYFPIFSFLQHCFSFLQHFPIFSPMLSIFSFLDPRRYFSDADVCNTGLDKC
jgi:hypothetical protein